MQGMEQSAPAADREGCLFVTARPGRAGEVVASKQDLLRRRQRELAFAAQIGMDISHSSDWILTGSTGTKPPHHIEEGIADDILP